MEIRKFVLFVVPIMMCGYVFGQSQGTAVEITSSSTVSTGPLKPMWLWANQWGRFGTNAEVYAKVGDTLYASQNFSLGGGLGGVYEFSAKGGYLHEGYLAARLFRLDFSAGLQAFSPTAINDKLTSGMFLGSSNARPLPRVSVGINQYVDVPLTNGWFQVRGGMSQSVLNDYRYMERGHEEIPFHEKFAYVRLSHWWAKPYFGIFHSVMYGGKNVAIDYWATFLGKGSAEVGGGEATNAAGSHAGLFDFGIDCDIMGWKSKLYCQKPFDDGSGMDLKHQFLKDHIIGVIFENPYSRTWLNGFSVELINTVNQSGPGFPDPYDATLVNPDDPSQVGVYFFPGSMDDPSAFMSKYYPGVESSGWDKDDIYSFLIEKVNQGYRFGGRDDYLNNGMYYSGWSYYGRSLGTPLFHTADQVREYAPDWAFRDEGSYFVNNRVRAVHVGLQGVVKDLEYRVKATSTMNYGSYSREYEGRSSWTKTANYFYGDGLRQTYLGLELNRNVNKSRSISAFAVLGVDWGELYDSYGVRFGITARPR